MSKQYRLGYSTEEYGWLYFTADSDEEAQDLAEQFEEGELDLEDFPDAVRKVTGGTYELINKVEETK